MHGRRPSHLRLRSRQGLQARRDRFRTGVSILPVSRHRGGGFKVPSIIGKFWYGYGGTQVAEPRKLREMMTCRRGRRGRRGRLTKPAMEGNYRPARPRIVRKLTKKGQALMTSLKASMINKYIVIILFLKNKSSSCPDFHTRRNYYVLFEPMLFGLPVLIHRPVDQAS